MAGSRTTHLQLCLLRLHNGDAAAGEELLGGACDRLATLCAAAMCKSYARVRRWEETDDVLQGALLRLHRALLTITPPTLRDFYRLATTQIRRELIDLCRHYYGPAGWGSRHDSVTPRPDDGDAPVPLDPGDASLDPAQLIAWTEFHRHVEELPADEQEVFALVWYQGLTQAEAAEVLAVSSRTVLRRWQAACLKLRPVLQGLTADNE